MTCSKVTDRPWIPSQGHNRCLRHFHYVNCRRNSPGRLPPPEDFFGVEPIHAAAALDSKGMDAAIARGPR